jgi:hypothetical protein
VEVRVFVHRLAVRTFGVRRLLKICQHRISAVKNRPNFAAIKYIDHLPILEIDNMQIPHNLTMPISLSRP